MNDSELCGRVIRVSFAKQQRFKEGFHKPIWMEEDYNKNQHISDTGIEKEEKKFFA